MKIDAFDESQAHRSKTRSPMPGAA